MTIAIFDLDDTIIDGACDILWNRFMIEKGLLNQQWFDEQLFAYNQLLINNTLCFQDYIIFIAASYFKLDKACLVNYCHEFKQEILQPRIRNQVSDWMHEHKNNNDTIYICTASFQQVSSCIMELLPADYLISSTIEYCQQMQRFDVTVCHGQEKPILIRNHLNNQTALNGSWGYSDSFRDAPMLQMVDHAVAVTPCEKLQAIAINNDWEIRNL